VGGISSAADRHDITRPSVASDEVVVAEVDEEVLAVGVGVEEAVDMMLAVDVVGVVVAGVSVGRGGRGLLLCFAGEGNTGGGGWPGGTGGECLPLLLAWAVSGPVAPLVSIISSLLAAEPLDLVDSCLMRVPDSRGSVN